MKELNILQNCLLDVEFDIELDGVMKIEEEK